MKKLNEQALQMQKLAGIITESEYNTEMAKMDNTPKMEAEEEGTSGGVTITSQEELDTYVEENGLVINGSIENNYDPESGGEFYGESIELPDNLTIKGNLSGGDFALGNNLTIEGECYFNVDSRYVVNMIKILDKSSNHNLITATHLAKKLVVNTPQADFDWGSADELVLPDNFICESAWCMLSAEKPFENVEKATIVVKGDLDLFGSFEGVDDNTFREFAKRLKVTGDCHLLFGFPSYSEEMTDEEIRQIFPNVEGEIEIRTRKVPNTKAQPDSAASMNEMNKMKRKSRM